MGPRKKYLTYRYLTRDSNDIGPRTSRALFWFMIGSVIIAVALLVGRNIYTTLQPIFIQAPNISAFLGGFLIAAILTIPRKYSPEEAKQIFAPNNGLDTSRFYIKSLIIVLIINSTAILISVIDEHPIKPYTDNFVIINGTEFIGIIAFFAIMYKMLHLPYRYHRLLQYSSKGTYYTLIYAMPISIFLFADAFDLPLFIESITAPQPIETALVWGAFNIIFLLPLLFLKFSAEDDILAQMSR